MTNAMTISTETVNQLSVNCLTENLVADWIKFCDVKSETQKTYLKSVKQFYLFLSERGVRSCVHRNNFSHSNNISQEFKSSIITD